jgi:hypothetical protein
MKIIVLFNLKPGVSAEDYEAWAKSRDIPVVNSLTSVDAFRIFRFTGLLGSDTPPPFQYTEIIDVNNGEVFFKEIGTDPIQALAAEFQQWADNPLFLQTSEIIPN